MPVPFTVTDRPTEARVLRFSWRRRRAGMQAPQNSTVIGQPAAAIASLPAPSWGARTHAT